MKKTRKMFISGNWKMNLLSEQAMQLVEGIKAGTARLTSTSKADPAASDSLRAVPEIVVCPPFVFLERIVERTRSTSIGVGAQNVFFKTNGAFTGEVSASMLKSIGCTHVIVGHSERRMYFHETDFDLNRKLRVCLECGLVPIFCVGETLAQREKGQTEEILNRQLVYGLEGIDGGQISGMVIAYEPVWAIGTGASATGNQAEKTHRFIRSVVRDFAVPEVAESVRIIYGGSVTPANAADLLTRENIDGALVGGASLKAETFCEIVKTAEN